MDFPARNLLSEAARDTSKPCVKHEFARQRPMGEGRFTQIITVNSTGSSKFDNRSGFIAGQCSSLARISPNGLHIDGDVRWDQQFSVDAEAMNSWISDEYARRERDARQEVWAMHITRKPR
jgi:hypothetical protein